MLDLSILWRACRPQVQRAGCGYGFPPDGGQHRLRPLKGDRAPRPEGVCVCVCVCECIGCEYACMCAYVQRLFTVCLSVCYVCVSFLSVWLCLSVRVSVCLSVCLSLSVCLCVRRNSSKDDPSLVAARGCIDAATAAPVIIIYAHRTHCHDAPSLHTVPAHAIARLCVCARVLVVPARQLENFIFQTKAPNAPLKLIDFGE